jgi:hypothetical protein
LQFSDLAEPVTTFEKVFNAALSSLVSDLSDKPWYIRERQIVNLFVFDHLIPAFRSNQPELDVGQINIETSIWITPRNESEEPGIPADIVVWPHRKATNWRTCKPMARIEWKNISCVEPDPSGKRKQHWEDVNRLCRQRHHSVLNYAILTLRQSNQLKLSFKKIDADEYPRTNPDFCALATAAFGDKTPYEGGYAANSIRPLQCPECSVFYGRTSPTESTDDCEKTDNAPTNG